MVGLYSTGPLAFPEPASGPRPLAQAAPVADPWAVPDQPVADPVVAPGAPAVDQTGSYPVSSHAPVGFNIPVQPALLVQQGVQDFDGLDPAERTQLNQLAGELGFASGRTLAHA
ncbi:MAG TPA: hypothetical protein V6D23_00995, partial [Candidatus Obscuribacterales bacterium]